VLHSLRDHVLKEVDSYNPGGFHTGGLSATGKGVSTSSPGPVRMEPETDHLMMSSSKLLTIDGASATPRPPQQRPKSARSIGSRKIT